MARSEPFDLTDVTYIKRITVGNSDPSNPKSEDELSKPMDLINECLSKSPKGIIIGMDKNFGVYNLGEHQVVLQTVTYHIGFTRKPSWLMD